MMLSAPQRRLMPFYALFCFTLILNIALWVHSRPLRPYWGNVPPVSTERGTIMAALGDRQMAYRMIGVMLQNLGSTGGQSFALRTYNYDHLRDWFFLENTLDPASNFMPALGAYYYGASQDIADLTPVIDYLEVAGQYPGPQRWRWLAHAVWLARYKQGDLTRALDLAETLAALPGDMPQWAYQMPAFVLNAQGNKEAAYKMMMGMLSTGAQDMSPQEILVIRDYICDQILTPDQARVEELCLKIKP